MSGILITHLIACHKKRSDSEHYQNSSEINSVETKLTDGNPLADSLKNKCFRVNGDTIHVNIISSWTEGKKDSVVIEYMNSRYGNNPLSESINGIDLHRMLLTTTAVGNRSYFAFVGPYIGAGGRGVDFCSIIITNDSFNVLRTDRTLCCDSLRIGDVDGDRRIDYSICEYAEKFYSSGRDEPGWKISETYEYEHGKWEKINSTVIE